MKELKQVEGKKDLVLSPLDKLEDPPSLLALREAVAARLPRVDLPEILLEINARTGFTDAFTHIAERTARTADLSTSLCAVLLAEACNTGVEPLLQHEVPALRRDRLSWVNQNYVRDETLIAANAKLVSAQNQIPLAQAWGGGEVASADGLRLEGHEVREVDVARLSPLSHEHINLLGRYSFVVPESVVRGELRPLRTPADGAP